MIRSLPFFHSPLCCANWNGLKFRFYLLPQEVTLKKSMEGNWTAHKVLENDLMWSVDSNPAAYGPHSCGRDLLSCTNLKATFVALAPWWRFPWGLIRWSVEDIGRCPSFVMTNRSQTLNWRRIRLVCSKFELPKFMCFHLTLIKPVGSLGTQISFALA